MFSKGRELWRSPPAVVILVGELHHGRHFCVNVVGTSEEDFTLVVSLNEYIFLWDCRRNVVYIRGLARLSMELRVFTLVYTPRIYVAYLRGF
jgi:hypothetical protein